MHSLPSPTSEAATAAASARSKAVHVDVVLEGMDPEQEWQIPEAIAVFLSKLGTLLSPPWLSRSPSTTSSQTVQAVLTNATRRPGGDPAAVTRALKELVLTEQSFLQRMRALDNGYARRLSEFSKSPATRIIGPYEARVMFSRVDGLVLSSERLLKTVESIWNMASATGGVCYPGDQGEWCQMLRIALDAIQGPFREYRTHYDEAKRIEQKLQKNQLFTDFCERTKAAMYDEKMGRVGLRELIMEPIQRVPRYKLLLEQMLVNMDMDHPGRPDLVEAVDACNRLAACEIDEESRRAAHMWGLNRAIDGFPAILIRDNRTFVDAIDVFDVPLATTPTTQQEMLCCTLFLFSDTLVIAKRPRASSGRTLAGLDANIYELVQEMQESRPGSSTSIAGGVAKPSTPNKVKKGKMSFKGLVDVHDLVAAQIHTSTAAATDPSFEIFFNRPPTDQSERWNARPQRLFVVATPGVLGPEAATRAAADRHRFLRNLWRAQALVKAVDQRPVLLDVMTAAEPTTASTTTPSKGSSIPFGPDEFIEAHWNLYEHECYERELRKHKVVLQLDATGAAPAFNFAVEGGPPHVIVRATFNHVEDPDCIVNIRTRADPDHAAEAIVPVNALSSFVVRSIDRLGTSMVPPRFPVTQPSTSAPISPPRTRSRAGSTAVDILPQRLFGASLSRTRSMTSKTSTVSNLSAARSGQTSQATTPALSHADSFAPERPPSSLSASVPASRKSPGGSVWYQHGGGSRPARPMSAVLDEGDTTVRAPAPELRHSESCPSIYSDDHPTTRRSPVAVAEAVDVQRADSRTSAHSDHRRPFGPRGLGFSVSRPASPSPPAAALEDDNSTGSDDRSPVRSASGRRESGASLAKRRREGEEEGDENRRLEEGGRYGKRSAAADPSNGVRLPPSRRKTARAPRRRRPVVDAKQMSVDDLGDVLMEEVGGAEDHAHDMDVDVKQIKEGVHAIRTLLASTLAARIREPAALSLSNSIRRSPRTKQLAEVEDKPLAGKLDVTALSTWLDAIDAIAGDLDGSLQMEIEAFKSTKTWLETQTQKHAQARAELTAAQSEASTLRAHAEQLRRQLQALEAQMSQLEVENDHLYEAFNEELDHLHADVQTAPDQAVKRLAAELQTGKAAKADLARRLGQETRKRARLEVERDAAMSECEAQKVENERLRRLLGLPCLSS